MYQFNVASPEVDALILDQMTDDDLVNFCQSDIYATTLCQIPRIKNRIDNYKYYKTFDISNIFDHIEQYCPYPIMIHRYIVYNTDNLFMIDNDIHILYQNSYVNILCLTQEDRQVDAFNQIVNENYMNMNVTKRLENVKLQTIINSYETNENSVWNLDLLSIYHIYNNIGLQKYAKLKVLEHLSEHKKLQSNYVDNDLRTLYKLFVLRLWFLSHIILYKLEDDEIDNLNIDIDDQFVQSEEFINYKMTINEDIEDFYNLLYHYIDKLN